ncbi:MAG: hypothetical protein Ta2A_19860 [Treponemataceae bacterium]|nr:MAG: hypothetical protein Ta2A_19860 [Treponemataceae bacterium]
MKSIKRRAIVLLVFAAVASTVLMSASKKKPKQKIENLDWKGSSLGQDVPDWVVKSQDSSIAIQSLSAYKGQYCFVVQIENDDKDFAINYVKNLANGAAQVSTMLSTTVNAMAESKLASASVKTSGGVSAAATSQAVSEVKDAMSNASFQNFRQAADFWLQVNNKSTKKRYFVAYSLWIVPQKDLNEQMARNYQNIIDNNKAISAAERQMYIDIIADIRTRGIATDEPLDY